MKRQPEVLVVGAGPTGLTLALAAHACGARVRVVEVRDATPRPSRALLVHARTLEVLRPLGVVDALLAEADTAPRVRLHFGSHTVPVSLGELALADTAFPHLTLLRQADVEAVLADVLTDRGVPVQWGVAFTGIAAGPAERVRVELRSVAGVELAECDYLVGCDGAQSTVRTAVDIGWRGDGYPEDVVLADAELVGIEPGVAHVAAGRAGLVFVFPVGERATWRILATRPAIGPDAPVTAEELRDLLHASPIGARLTTLAWASRVRLAHRLADAYRRGRVFLAGDACHSHSPAGGQGMNTGIQDGANLGWKLAYAPSSSDSEGLLDSYELERRPVARTVLALTDLAFWAESSRDPVASILRGVLVPLGAPFLPPILRWRRLVAEGIRTIAGLRVDYRGGPLSVQRGPRRAGPRAGDRLPDATVTVAGRRVRLHELTARPGVHVLLQRDAPEPVAGQGPRVAVDRVTDWDGEGLIAVRPDGYVGLRSDAVDHAALRRWLERIGAIAR